MEDFGDDVLSKTETKLQHDLLSDNKKYFTHHCRCGNARGKQSA